MSDTQFETGWRYDPEAGTWRPPAGVGPHGHAAVAAGVTDHGALIGLADDDHPQYATDADLAAHTASGDPHPGYATDTDLTTHAGAADPHTGYQKESEKGIASGYASLDSGLLVPTAQLGGAGADATKYLRGDRTWVVPPAAIPASTLAEVENLGHNTNVTTEPTDIPGMAVTFTVPAGRRIRVTAKQHLSSTVAGDRVTLRIAEGGTELNAVFMTLGIANSGEDLFISHVLTPAAGTHTYKLQGGRSAGTGTVTTYTNPPVDSNYLLVEDITGTTQPYDPTSVPVGVLGQTIAPAGVDQGSITTTETTITGLSVNVVVPAGRLVQIHVSGAAYSSVANDSGLLRIKEGATTLSQFSVLLNPTYEVQYEFTATTSPSAASHTYTVTLVRQVGTGTLTHRSNGTIPARIWVEDITPTPAASSGAPGSTLGYAEVTANQNGISAETALTGLSVTVTVPAGRRLRITGKGQIVNDANVGAVAGYIKEGTTQLGRWVRHDLPSATYTLMGSMSQVVSPAAGTHTYYLSLHKNAGAGTLDYQATATNPGSILVEDITGSVWPAGSPVTAGMVASEAWTDFTPANLNVTVGNGTQVAKYMRIGRTIFVRYSLLWGSTTAFTGVPHIGLPVTPASSGTDTPPGVASLLDNGTRWYTGHVSVNEGGANVAQLHHSEGTTGNVDATNPFTWTTGDRLSVSITYEAAA